MHTGRVNLIAAVCTVRINYLARTWLCN